VNKELEDLQTHIAFQEHSIAELNDALISQQKQLDMSASLSSGMWNTASAASPTRPPTKSRPTISRGGPPRPPVVSPYRVP
jgi:uncharacterized coiled-coil protein SlyX